MVFSLTSASTMDEAERDTSSQEFVVHDDDKKNNKMDEAERDTSSQEFVVHDDNKSNNKDDNVDCPICLDAMNAADLRHPLLCPTRHCGYNFCLSCIQSLVSSSKDDYEEASDGNRHVKVFLHCPNCRSDLSKTICDTMLLRRVDTVIMLMQRPGFIEEQLNASQLRMKRALSELDVQEAIEEARETELLFLAKQQSEEEQEKSDKENKVSQHVLDSNVDDEEWGVEADLDQGVHNSIRLPREFIQSICNSIANRNAQRKRIDSTLFGGLDYFMTHAEQLQVTQLMTSGDCRDLVKAAGVLRQAQEYCHQGIAPSCRTLQRKGSVYAMVDQVIQIHEEASKPKVAPVEIDTPRIRRKPVRVRGGLVTATEHRQVDLELREQMEYLQFHPLPVRMPKLVELTLCDPSSRHFALQFCNDVWDGTVLDAYSKITIARDRITKNKTQHRGVYYVLSGGKYFKHYDQVRMGAERRRVLVSSVKSEGGKQGVMKGDVVTHVNGKEFTGNCSDLIVLIRDLMIQNEMNEGESSTFEMVLNAEPSVAEALKRRSVA